MPTNDRPIEDVVTTYFRYYESAFGATRNKDKAAAREWVAQYVIDVIARGDESSVELVIALSDGASNDEEFAFLGAGPLEDVFNVLNVAPVTLMESALRTHPNVRYAFKFTWLHALPSEVAAQLQEYHGGPKPE